MKHLIIRTLVATLLAGGLAVGLQASPASANASEVQLSANTLSPQYLVDGCLYRTRFGNFGSTAYAQMRIYNPASCGSTRVGLVYADGSGTHMTSKGFSEGYSTGSDGCGSYREVQVTSPSAAYAVKAMTAPKGSIENWRFYSTGGQATQPINSTC